MSWSVINNGTMRNVNAILNGGSLTLGSFSETKDVEFTYPGGVSISGFQAEVDFTMENPSGVGSQPWLTVSANEVRGRIRIDGGSTLGYPQILISGDYNTGLDIDSFGANRDIMDVSGEGNAVRLNAICNPITDDTYDGVSLLSGGNLNRITGHILSSGANDLQYGWTAVAFADNNSICLSVPYTATGLYSDAGSGNQICEVVGHTHAAGDSVISVEKGGTLVGSQPTLNFIEGTGVTLTITDDAVNDEIDIEIAATAGGGGDMLKSVYDPTTIEADAFDLQYAHGTLDLGTF